MGIADSFRQLAEKAKARMAAEGSTSTDDDVDLMDEKYDNAGGDRFDLRRDRVQEPLNERPDDFGGDRREVRNTRNRDMPGA
ncbi:MAG TPA: hypothetical protein VFT95_18255 [Micromonosporaceae bacterium]|nr:hypothetical protein [Micromonosporaceae bacterium]